MSISTCRALAGLVLLAAIMPTCGPSRPVPPRGPAKRVILITCDTLRADHLGCYGYARPTTPNVDAFAQESVLFENAYSAAPLTGPSLSSLLAGRFPDEIGAGPTNNEIMPASVETLAEVLSKAGIHTAAFVSNSVLSRSAPEQGDIGVKQGFATFDDEMNSREVNRGILERTAAACTDAALKWLARQSTEEPFFLWVHYQDPHGPYTPPEDVQKLFARAHADEAALAIGTNNSGQGQIPKYQLVGGERKPGEYVDRYDGEVRYFDTHLGRLFEWLRAHGMWDDSLIVFTSDHGESLGDHGYFFCHGEHVHRDLLHVPLIVHPPRALRSRAIPSSGSGSGSAPASARREARLAMHLDVWPTVLQALGVSGPENRGSSLCAQLPEGRVALSFLGPILNPNHRMAVTDGRWRVVLVKQDPPALFDLSTDPGETHDVAKEHLDVVNDLHNRYKTFMAQHAVPLVPGTRRKMDAAQERSMNATGYAGADRDDH